MGKFKPAVFVVDHEYLIASTLVLILNQVGFAATGFACPLKAIQAAETQCPDIVIADVQLPAMSGIELAIHFGKHFPECKMLLISGQVGTDDLLASAREQGNYFEVLAKPFHPDILLATLELLSS